MLVVELLPPALPRYQAMCVAIAEAIAIDEVLEIRNQAAAFRAYAKQARNTEAERLCAVIRIRAERRAGELLAQMEKLKGRPQKASPLTRLSELGISYDESSRWQHLAAVPKDDFEAELANFHDEEAALGTSGILRRAAMRASARKCYGCESGASPAPTRLMMVTAPGAEGALKLNPIHEPAEPTPVLTNADMMFVVFREFNRDLGVLLNRYEGHSNLVAELSLLREARRLVAKRMADRKAAAATN